MLRNYLRTSLRNLARQKLHALINVFGLSLGLASCLLIFLYVFDEFSYDRFHDKADSIFAVAEMDYFMDFKGTVGPTMGMAPLMEDYFPEVKHAVRMFSWGTEASVRFGDRIFKENPVMTDREFFEVFSFPLIKGDPRGALGNRDSVVLSRSAAKRYFGNEDPLGKTLIFSFGGRQKEFLITAVCVDVPENSSVRFDMLIPIENVELIHGSEYLTNMRWFNTRTFVLLDDGASPQNVDDRFPAFVDLYFQETLERRHREGRVDPQGRTFTFWLQNIKGIHLDPSVVGNYRTSDIRSSMILSGIALLILLIACINFMNLSIGRSAGRSVEIGVRMVLGADRKQLIHQFWTEAILITLFAGGMGVLLAGSALPVFNGLARKNLTLEALWSAPVLLTALVFIILIGIAAGSFPAMVMAGFPTVEVFKGKFKLGGKNLFTRAMVVVQFSCAVFLILTTMVMSRQIRYLNNRDLGFDKEGVIVIQGQEREYQRSESVLKEFKSRVQGHESVEMVSASWSTFGRHLTYAHMEIDGENTLVNINKVYYDYLDTLGIELLQGRDFSPEIPGDRRAVIVNESYVERMGLENPVGAAHLFVSDFYPPMNIIGVIKDYNFQSLREQMEPSVLMMEPENPQPSLYHILVRISPQDIPGTLDFLHGQWKEVQPYKPFLYSFMDQDVENVYFEQKRWNDIVKYTSVLAVLITCLGIFGLTSIALSRRIKEIGIRKVLGASVSQIYSLVLKDFLLLVVIANAFAWPVAYLIMRGWLNDFAYRADLGVLPFLLAGGLSLGIALLTLSFQSLRAASANPVDSLRYE